MFSILKKLFSNKDSANLVESYDDKYECIEIKKNKLSNEEVIYDEILYVHELPAPFRRKQEMPSQLETPDNINTNQVEIIDQKTGKKMMLDASQASQMQEKVPDGINVPGLGKFDNKKKAQGQRRAPQQGAPQQQAPRQAAPQQQQQQQQVPQQQVPQQQGYPPQQQQAPQGYPQQQPQGFQPQGGYPQQNGYNVIPDYNQQPPQQVHVNQSAGQYLPPSEIAMVEGAYHVYVDLPGVSKESLNVSFNAGTLNVTGERAGSITALRKEIKGPRGRKDPILTEHNTIPPFLVGKFEFKYPFQRLIDESKLEANMVDGVLHVMLPHRVKGEEVSIPIM
jgi:HSP20 family molecular chaperone IbpA